MPCCAFTVSNSRYCTLRWSLRIQRGRGYFEHFPPPCLVLFCLSYSTVTFQFLGLYADISDCVLKLSTRIYLAPHKWEFDLSNQTLYLCLSEPLSRSSQYGWSCSISKPKILCSQHSTNPCFVPCCPGSTFPNTFLFFSSHSTDKKNKTAYSAKQFI